MAEHTKTAKATALHRCSVDQVMLVLTVALLPQQLLHRKMHQGQRNIVVMMAQMAQTCRSLCNGGRFIGARDIRHTHPHSHTHTHTHTHARARSLMHVSMHTNTDTHTQTHTHRHTDTQTHRQTHRHRHRHTDTHTHTPTRTHAVADLVTMPIRNDSRWVER